jgi:hypothetical protein
MAKRERAGGIEPAYESPEVLTELLRRAGSALTASDVASRFRDAQAQGGRREVVIPALFEGEPRFASPEEARRLYANLFGLWARVKTGTNGDPHAPPAPAPQEAPPLPPRGSQRGPRLDAALVDAVWRTLDLLAPRERRRRQDRYEAAQPDLSAWAAALALPDIGAVAAQDLAFELWAMFDHAFGERLGTVSFASLRALEAEPPALELEQPAIAAYVGEVLDILAAEEPGFDEAAQAQVGRAAATVAAALGARVQGAPA